MDSVKLPRGEVGVVRYLDIHRVLRYILTSKNTEGVLIFCLYEVSEDGLKRLGKGKSPLALEEKFEIERVLRDG